MTSFQKLIKYAAIAFGTYLSFMIIGGIIFTFTIIFGVTMGIDAFQNTNNQSQTLVEHTIQEYANVQRLDIELGVCQLEVKKGDKIKVETSNISDKFECRVQGNTLKIKDKEFNINWFNSMQVTPKVIIYIPETIEFEDVELKLGISDTSIEYLKCDKLDMEAGVGRNLISNLIAENAKIKGGAGETTISSSTIGTFKLDAGIGKFVMTSRITEEGKIASGVGKLELNLTDSQDNYTVKAKSGLGNCVVNGTRVTDSQTIGDGDCRIKIDAGIGETIINFNEKLI